MRCRDRSYPSIQLHTFIGSNVKILMTGGRRRRNSSSGHSAVRLGGRGDGRNPLKGLEMGEGKD